MRYLFGPVSRKFADDHLFSARAAGECLAFEWGPGADLAISPDDTWESFQARLPAGWRPDFIALYLPYRTIPEWMWAAPVPLVGLAGDANLLWHCYRRQLPGCDLVLADTETSERLEREARAEGREVRIRAFNLYGAPASLADSVGRLFQAVQDGLENPSYDSKDIDILFVGNFNPCVQRERLPLLARVARLADRYRVTIVRDLYGEEYHKLLARARIVFNRGIRGEWNSRVGEALAAGALLFQEAGNREVACHLTERRECVFYTEENLEQLLAHYLEHEDERLAIAMAGRRRLPELTFEALWESELEQINQDLPALREQARDRANLNRAAGFELRCWQALNTDQPLDTRLVSDLNRTLKEEPNNAELLNALGLVLAWRQHGKPPDLVAAAAAFRRAWESNPGHLLAGLNLAEVLGEQGENAAATEQAGSVLAALEAQGDLDPTVLNAGHYPSFFDDFRVSWECAAWEHAGAAENEIAAKRNLICWRLHLLLGKLTEDLAHLRQAAKARPELAISHAALGMALAGRKQWTEAAVHLRRALDLNPFDGQTAQALFEALGEAQTGLACDYRLLHKAAAGMIPAEPWLQAGSEPQRTQRSQRTRIAWEGGFTALHSLVLVNRRICLGLLERGHELTLLPTKKVGVDSMAAPLEPRLAELFSKPLSGPADIHVAHQWPPSFEPPREGRWVIMQPWEFGSLPKSWIAPMSEQADEIWVPSRFVRDCFIKSGVPAERVQVIPLGVDPCRVRGPAAVTREECISAASAAGPRTLQTPKAFKFLFVGGTIHRKGIDLLLEAYRAVFSAAADVCLVIKDMGAANFYHGQTANALLEAFRKDANAPEIEYIDRELTEEEMAGLYRSCDCLVHPFRGEGFGLPIIEAMGHGLPVIVTGYGPVLDYASDETAYLLPAREVRFATKEIDGAETVDFPWLAEPDIDMLCHYLRHVVENPAEAKAKGEAARQHVLAHFTWEHTLDAVESRLRSVAQSAERTPAARSALRASRSARISLCMIVKNEEAHLEPCLRSVSDLVDEIIIADTGSTDRTKQIAARYGAKVVDFVWQDSFAAARNESLKHATGDWIFWLDADEQLDDANRQRLWADKNSPPLARFWTPQLLLIRRRSGRE